MRNTTIVSLAGLLVLLPQLSRAEDVKDLGAEVNKLVAADSERLESLYKHLHSHPELSNKEERTAGRLAKEMKDLGFEVTEKVGGTGIVAVFKNGKGPTVLVR